MKEKDKPMDVPERRKLRALHNLIKECFPLKDMQRGGRQIPVRLEIREGLEERGSATIINRKAYIRLCRGMSYPHAVDVLCHEWAHLLAWDAESPHGDEWGKAFAMLYRFKGEEP